MFLIFANFAHLSSHSVRALFVVINHTIVWGVLHPVPSSLSALHTLIAQFFSIYLPIWYMALCVVTKLNDFYGKVRTTGKLMPQPQQNIQHGHNHLQQEWTFMRDERLPKRSQCVCNLRTTPCTHFLRMKHTQAIITKSLKTILHPNAKYALLCAFRINSDLDFVFRSFKRRLNTVWASYEYRHGYCCCTVALLTNKPNGEKNMHKTNSSKKGLQLLSLVATLVNCTLLIS